MSSIGAKIVKAAIRIYTFPKRRKHISLSRTVKFKESVYRPPQGFTYRVTKAGGVKVEILAPPLCDKDCAVVHFHGGGHTVGMNDFYRGIAERYAKLSGCAVYSIDYEPHAALRHPALLDDCYAAFTGLVDGKMLPQKLIMAGDSMGANLILATCLKLRDAGRAMPTAIVSVSVGSDLSSSGDSYRKNCHSDPLYSLPRYQSFAKNEAGIRRITPYVGDTDTKDPYLSPAFAALDGFPKMLIQCGDCETSESDNDMVYANAVKAGVDVKMTKYKGMFHDFQYIVPFLKESKAAWREIAAFIREVKESK